MWVQTEDELRMSPSKGFSAEESVGIIERFRDSNEPTILILRYINEKMFKDKYVNLAREIPAIDDSIAAKVEHIHRIPSKMEKFVYGCKKMSEKGKKSHNLHEKRGDNGCRKC